MFQRLLNIACGIGCLLCLGLNTVVARQDNSANPLRRSTPLVTRASENTPTQSAAQSSKEQTNDEPEVDATQALKIEALTRLYPTRRECDLSEVIPPTTPPKSNRRVIPIQKPVFPNYVTPAKFPARDTETSQTPFDTTTKPIYDPNFATTTYNAESESPAERKLTEEREFPADLPTHDQGKERGVESAIVEPIESSETQSDDGPVARTITLGEFLDSPEKIKEERQDNVRSPELKINGRDPIANDELPFAGSSNDFVETLQKIATSTCLVLILGVGFILVAKRFSFGKSAVAKSRTGKARAAEAPLNFRVVGHFKLGAKSSLQIIEVGDQKFLIANDSTGIKSVVPIGTPFVNTLDDLAIAMSEKANDERDETVTYTPAAKFQSIENLRGKRASSANTATGQDSQNKTNTDVEEEMRRQLAELLGGQAFKDVFYEQTKTVT
ncbi:MAG: flagellar biosynthetic protein FliO [Pirellulaceae bacterium]